MRHLHHIGEAQSIQGLAASIGRIPPSAGRWLDTVVLLVNAGLMSVWVLPATASARDWALLVLVNLLLCLCILSQAELNKSWRGRPYSDQFARLFIGWTGASALTVLVWFALQMQSVLSSTLLGAWLSGALILLVVVRGSVHLLLRALRRLGLNAKRVVLYGAGPVGQSILRQIQGSPESGFSVVAILDDNETLLGEKFERTTVVNGFGGLGGFLSDHSVDEIWLALPLSAADRLTKIRALAQEHGKPLRYFPDLAALGILDRPMSELLGMPSVDLSSNRLRGLNRALKSAEDKALSVLLLVPALPLMLLVALAVRLSSPGPVLFRQRRNGFDGRPFTIYKFRTMYVEADMKTAGRGGLPQATQNDPRVTPIGRWLRRFSMDELPQLINVLQGKMSLVGPRPHAVEHNAFYSQHIEGYMRRHHVKPGITGWAQVNDLRGETQTVEEMSRRVKHDLYYIEHWSLGFDLRILLTTVLKVLFSRNAW